MSKNDQIRHDLLTSLNATCGSNASDAENITYKNIKMSSFKSSENIQKKESGPDRSVLDNQSSSVTLNELATKARKMVLFRVSARKSIYMSIYIQFITQNWKKNIIDALKVCSTFIQTKAVFYVFRV